MLTLLKESSNNAIGIFTHTDELALRLVYECAKEKIKIPEQVQIIGFDGWNLTPNVQLKISSIRQPIKDIAKTAVYQLNAEIRNPEETQQVRKMLPVTFKPGNTTIN